MVWEKAFGKHAKPSHSYHKASMHLYSFYSGLNEVHFEAEVYNQIDTWILLGYGALLRPRIGLLPLQPKAESSTVLGFGFLQGFYICAHKGSTGVYGVQGFRIRGFGLQGS